MILELLRNKHYSLLLLGAIFFLILFSIKDTNEKLVINIHDTYYVISSKDAFVLSSSTFFLTGLFYLIYYQLGVVFVRHLEGAEASAYYTVAFTFLTAALLVPSVIYQKFLLPKLHRWAYHDKEKFEKSYYYGNYIMLFLGILGFLFLWFFSPYFVNLFFGEKYQNSIHLVQLMAINIPIVYVASSVGSLLVTQEYMKIKVYYMGISALLSLILSVPMIKTYGIEGAIYTNIICNSFILCIYFYKVKKDILTKKVLAN
jgi:O-antigen/teichoic acid export membrane protein